MRLYKIAVGTTSEQKIGFLKRVLQEIGVGAETIPCPVESGITDQPLTSAETKSGSANRAKNALIHEPDADFGLGIEVGYQKNPLGKYEMLCWASIATKNHPVVSACSHRFLLPEFHQQILRKNGYLGEHVREYLAETPDPIGQIIGIDIRDREPFIRSAVRSCLLIFLKKEDYAF